MRVAHNLKQSSAQRWMHCDARKTIEGVDEYDDDDDYESEYKDADDDEATNRASADDDDENETTYERGAGRKRTTVRSSLVSTSGVDGRGRRFDGLLFGLVMALWWMR